jgi:hypothetical protein
MNITKMNLEPRQEEFLHECLGKGRRFFVTRRRSRDSYRGYGPKPKRTIQGSAETLENALKTFNGWKHGGWNVSLIEVKTDGTLEYHAKES